MDIFDFHAHIYPEKIASRAVEGVGGFYHIPMHCDGLAETLIKNGKEGGISHFLVHSVATSPKHVTVINDFIADECKKHEEFYGFGTMHPEFENKEEEILLNWVSTLPSPYNKELYSLYDEMIKQETEESKVYKALDKLEASISHNEAPISTWIDIEYKLNPVYGYEECQFNPDLKKLQNKVKEIALDKIENEGKI